MIVNSNIQQLNLDIKVPNSNKIEFSQNKPINKTLIEAINYPNLTFQTQEFYTYDRFIFGEDLIGLKNGINNIFTINSLIIPDSEQILSNGFIINKPEDYNITGNNIILNFNPNLTEQLTINYIKL